MSSFRKYFLVEPNKYNSLVEKAKTQTQSDMFTHPNIKAAKRIDSEIKTILEDSEMNDSKKMEEYNSKLDSYMRNFRNALEIPRRDALLGSNNNSLGHSEAKSAEIPISTNNDSDIKSLEEVVESVPKSYRPAAKHLRDFLNQSKKFSLNGSGELKYKDDKKFNLEAGELLNSVVRYKKHPGNNADLNEFVAALKAEGYPISRLAYVRRSRSTIPKLIVKKNSVKLLTKSPAKVSIGSKRSTKHHPGSKANVDTPALKRRKLESILQKWEETE